jgi:hypothetical protein
VNKKDEGGQAQCVATSGKPLICFSCFFAAFHAFIAFQKQKKQKSEKH